MDLAGKFMGVRDFVLNKLNVPSSQSMFIKAITGGAPTQTTMTPEELRRIKQAQTYQKFEPRTDLMNYERDNTPVVSLYEPDVRPGSFDENMKNTYGRLSVYPQQDGGVRIYDKWKVDPSPLDTLTEVSDLVEGGAPAAFMYNASKALGLYRPIDIEVTVPGSEWRQYK